MHLTRTQLLFVCYFRKCFNDFSGIKRSFFVIAANNAYFIRRRCLNLNMCQISLKLFVNFLWLNVWTWKLHCAFPFDSDMKWLNHGYSRIFVKAMVVGVVTKPLHKILKTNRLSIFEERSWPTKFKRQPLSNNLWRGISPQEINAKQSPPKTISKETSCFDEKWQTSKLMKFNENGIFHQISSVLFLCHAFCYVFFVFGFFGGNVSSFFLVEISLQIFFS